MTDPTVKPELEDSAFQLSLRGAQLDCRPGANVAHVAGILNVTPDSFYDGGMFLDYGVALRRAEQIMAEGAVMIDVGGASSRPRGTAYGTGATVVSPDEEWGRVGPIIKGIVRELPEAIVSVDTFHDGVARKALDAGAHLINDITALRVSPGIADVVAAAGAGLILMHSVGEPGAMPHEHEYDDVVLEVSSTLAEACQVARAAGVKALVVDPGFGFGKKRRDNMRLIAETASFLQLGSPVMVGVSRKSSIGAAVGGTLDSTETTVPPSDRLFGSLGATAIGVMEGATLVRTHDVRETVEMLRVMAAVVERR
ncbi:MAG: dihydropteroate synthase [Rhodothermales bacterium]|nr:dihydropteroate synthase [Rhodothermales bacterium]